MYSSVDSINFWQLSWRYHKWIFGMNWEAICSASEAASVVPVLVSILYLTAQVRQNTNAVKGASHHAVNAPMERFFRSLKTEWVPALGYRSFTEAQQSITECLVSYYSQTRPHQHNRGLSPNAAERQYWINY